MYCSSLPPSPFHFSFDFKRFFYIVRKKTVKNGPPKKCRRQSENSDIAKPSPELINMLKTPWFVRLLFLGHRGYIIFLHSIKLKR